VLAVCFVTTLVTFAACGGDDESRAHGDAGSDAGGEAGGGASTAGSPATGGSIVTGDGGASLGGRTSAGGGEPGLAGEPSIGAGQIGGSPSAAGADGVAGAGGAVTCEIGAAQSPAAPGTLDLFGQIAYFGSGQVLPAGRYRVSYVDGCMKYSSAQDWAIHAYADGSIAWWLGKTSGDKLVMLPGTIGIYEGQGGYSEFNACVAANQPLQPVEFDFEGGVLGIWLADSNYGDNLSGVDGRNPSWKLTLLGDSCE
jgi:hypothetical protein